MDRPPTKVVHIRGLGPDVTQMDLLGLASTFGRVAHCVLLKSKNQALLQMADVPSAVNFVQHFSHTPCLIRGSRCYVQFSNHQELTTASEAAHGSGNILLITISNPMYPITVDVLVQVFGPYGALDKCVIFNKDDKAGLQALVQYRSPQSASAALAALQGMNIYPGCCQLFIQYSKLVDLTVRYNNERSRDFNNPSLPPGPAEGSAMAAAAAAAAAGVLPGMPGMMHGMGYGGMPGAPGMTPDRTVVHVSNLNPERVTVDKVFALLSCFGNIQRVRILRDRPNIALVQFADPMGASMAVSMLRGVVLFGKPLEVAFSKHPQVVPTTEADGEFAKEFDKSTLNRFTRSGPKQLYPPGPSLHVSNISPGFTEEIARQVFSPFGTVQNVKFFESGGYRQCMIDMGSVTEATEALVSLHGANVAGSEIRVAYARQRTGP